MINIGAQLAITVFIDSINGNTGKLVLLIKHVSYMEVDSRAKTSQFSKIKEINYNEI